MLIGLVRLIKVVISIHNGLKQAYQLKNLNWYELTNNRFGTLDFKKEIYVNDKR